MAALSFIAWGERCLKASAPFNLTSSPQLQKTIAFQCRKIKDGWRTVEIVYYVVGDSESEYNSRG